MRIIEHPEVVLNFPSESERGEAVHAYRSFHQNQHVPETVSSANSGQHRLASDMVSGNRAADVGSRPEMPRRRADSGRLSGYGYELEETLESGRSLPAQRQARIGLSPENHSEVPSVARGSRRKGPADL